MLSISIDKFYIVYHSSETSFDDLGILSDVPKTSKKWREDEDWNDEIVVEINDKRMIDDRSYIGRSTKSLYSTHEGRLPEMLITRELDFTRRRSNWQK